ncbi:MAG: hypothetical protein KIS78_20430 [Labilithrix sp.]|nr:hypothetical protein [Labilithrix sp.]MCW5834783.1 hypothetical protein [Labilithrix sp.]
MRRRRACSVALFAALGALGFAPSEARAEEPGSDYCRAITARAEADSALLFAPTVHAQVVRFPSNGYADTTGLQSGRGLQPRAAMSIGLVDIYKGLGVRDVAKKDCLRHEATTTLREMLAQRNDAGLRAALTKKLEYLKAHEPELQAAVEQAEARFAAGSGTLIEVNEIRRRVLESSTRAAESERALAAMTTRGFVAPDESIEDLLAQYESRSVAYEKSVEHLRNLSPWKFNVTGGATAHPDVDYFGFVELTYNIGGLFQGSAEARAVEARSAETKNARYEMRQQVEALRRELRTQAGILRRQAQKIEEETTRLSSARAAIEPTDAPNKPHVLAMLSLQVIDLEAERVFLNTLADRQSAIGGRQ